MSKTGMTIYHANTRSIYNKISQIQLLYADIDVLCCTETWLDNRVIDKLVELKDKTIFRSDRFSNVSDYRKNFFGGGVCIYIAKPYSLFSQKIDQCSTSCKDYEIVTVSIIKPKFRHMLIICVYKPPTGKLENCITYIRQILSNPLYSKYEIWLLGDFNTDLLKRNDPKVISLQSFSRKSGLEQKIMEITRPNKRGGSCIDLIMTNCPFVRSSGVLNDYVSDHYTVYCVRKKNREKKECTLKTSRQYRNYNHDHFVHLLRDKNWVDYDNMLDPNEQWIFIKEVALEILSIMCPYKTIHVRKISTPWITPEIFNMIKEKQELVRSYKIQRDPDILNRMRVLHNELNTKIDKAKAVYIENKLHLYGKHPKKFWRIINSMIKQDSNSNISNYEFKSHTGENVPKEDIPNFLNDFFATIAQKTSDNSKVIHEMKNLDVPVQFDFEPPTLLELEYIVKSFNDDMSSCVNGLNMKMCKRLLAIIPEKFLLLYANSMFYGTFPREWTTADVTLLPKSGDLKKPENWRPISNTNIFSKVLEKLVQRQMNTFIFKNEIISDCQYGFVPGRSTHKAVFKVVNNIYSAINNNKYVGVVFLDIAKAFNCVDHEILDIILSNQGFSERVRHWFTSYNYRFQRVKIDKTYSDVKHVVHGAAQGTVLGPTIFILYFNAISLQVNKCKVSMFADDCVIYQSGNTWDTIHRKLQSDLNNIVSWTGKNFLTLNKSKTQAMIIGSKTKLKHLINPDMLLIDGVNVKFVKQYNYLGILLDEEMTLQPLLKHVKKIITNRLFSLRKIRKYINDKAAVLIYKQTLLPVVDYSGFLILSCCASDRYDLQTLQNDILRVCYRSRLTDRVRISDLHNKAKLLSLEQRMRKQLLWLMYNMSLDRNNRKVGARALRSNNKYIFKTDNKVGTKYQCSPYYKGTLLWNELPKDIQFAGDVYEFKKRVKRRYRKYENLL